MGRRVAVAVLLSLGCAALAAAQTVNVTLMLRNPMPAQLSVWEQDNTVLQLMLFTRSGIPNVRVAFTIRDLNNGGAIVAQSKDNSPSMPRFTLPQGPTTLTGPQIVNGNAVEVNGDYKTKAATSNTIPEGDYEFCIRLLMDNGTEIAATGALCRSFSIVIPDPPTLILPQHQAVLNGPTPPTFTWTQTVLGGANIPQYRLTIAPMFGSQTGRNAIEANTPLYQATSPMPNHLYGPGDPPFSLYPTAVGFAWQVQVLDQQMRPAARNEGKSEIFTFRLDTASVKQDTSAPPPPKAPSACSGNATAPTPSPSGGASITFAPNDLVHLGLFDMKVVTASGSGTGLTGTGTVSVPFLKAPIEVEFSGIQVNTNKQLVNGQVTAKIANVPGLSSTNANQLGSVLGLDSTQVAQAWSMGAQTQRLVSAFTGSTPTDLPIGLDNDIAGEKVTVGVIGMVFTPTIAYLNAVAMFALPALGPDAMVALGARKIAFHPGGLGTDSGVLYLVKDLGYNNPASFSFQFKAQTVSDSGTYLEWDCKGFEQLRVRAEVSFPRDWMTPIPDNGIDRAKAVLTAHITKGGDWIASASMDSTMLAGVNGMKLVVKEMTYDQSDLRNPEGITFPADYAGSKGADWHGFYIKTAMLVFPPSLQTFSSGPPAVAISNLLIDRTGITGNVLATNLIQFPKGNFGEWGASIDTVGIDLVSSSLRDGRMIGRLQIPISDDPLDYSAILSNPPKAKMKFLFTIQPRSDLKASFWAATLTLDKNSHIDLVDSAGSFVASATLNGNLSIHGKVGDLPNIDLQLMKFENVVVASKSPYILSGNWKFASPDHGISGFPVTIKNIAVATGNRKSGFGVGLRFELDANIGEVLSGGTTLSVWGVLATSGGVPQKFAFDGVDLDAITIKADLGAVQIDGLIQFYHDHPTYGNGFRGAVSANFLQQIIVKATAQFGSVNGYRYWYVDAAAMFPNPGLTLFPGIGIYGFGGGAWYHMTRTSSGDPGVPTATMQAGNDPGSTASGYTFVPDVNTAFGLRAMITMGTSPVQEMFNCDVAISVQFTSGGGVGLIALDGQGYFVESTPSARSSALLFATVGISYDFVNKVFEGNFAYATNPTFKTLFEAKGWLNIHVDPVNWHFLLGTPSNRNKLTLLTLATVDAYLMAGTDIPAPDFNNFEHKSDIESAIGSPLPTVHMPFPAGPTSGLAFGASQYFDTGDIRFLIFFGRLNLGYGFDVAFTHDVTRVCENTGSAPGVNGWYAAGQLYAYIAFKIGLHVDVWFTEGDFTILDMGAGARCIVMAPNPIWVEGTVGGHYSILGGLVSGQCSFTFDIGTQCEISTENPLAAVDIITDMQPGDGVKGVDVFAVPKAALNFPVDAPQELQWTDKNGNVVDRTFRVELNEASLSRVDNGTPVGGSMRISDDAYGVGFMSLDAFPEYTQLRYTVTVRGEEYKNGGWSAALKRNGDPVVQTRSVVFTTGKRPDVIMPGNVVESMPLNLQKHYLQGESHNGSIRALKSGYLFQEPGSYFVRLVPLTAADTVESPATYDMGSNTVRFTLPTMANNVVYAALVVRRSDPKLVLSLPTQVLIGSGSTRGLRSVLGPGGTGVTALSSSAGTGGVVKAGGTLGTTATTSLGASFVQYKTRSLPGTEVRANEKLLYSYYFQTSKFNTLSEKVGQLTFNRLDYTKYWGDYERMEPVYSTQEGWDDYDMKGRDFYDGASWTHRDPLIHVDAHLPSETWFKQYAWPSIYRHILDLKLSRLWDENVVLADKFFLLFGMVNFDQTVIYTGASDGKLHTPGTTNYVGFSAVKGTGNLSSALFLSSSMPPSLRLRYLHGEQIPADYFALWFRVKMMMLYYGSETADDPGSGYYGTTGFVDANAGWMQSLAARDITTMQQGYQLMRPDSYTLSFIYGPKFTWDAGGPWIKKTFRYGQGFGNVAIQAVSTHYTTPSTAVSIYRHLP